MPLAPTDRPGADPITEHLTRRSARTNPSDARARRYALRTVKPSPARLVAPEPDVWLPIVDVTAELEALDITGELELLALEEGRIDLERELENLETDFWRSAEADHPFLTGEFPAATGPAPLSIFHPSSPDPGALDPGALDPGSLDLGTSPSSDAELAALAPALAPSPSKPDPGSAPATLVPAPPVVSINAAVADAGLADLPIPLEYARLRPNRPAITNRRRSLRLRRRVIVTALVVAVSAAFVGATAQVLGGTSPRRDVTVSVDGRASTIVTRSGTVRDVLAARGIALRDGDRVVPNLATQLRQGKPIKIHRAFPVVVDIDGVVTTRRPSRHRLPALRRELGLPKGLIALNAPARLDRGDRLALRTPHQVTFVVDGTTTPLSKVTALTVGELLTDRNVSLGPKDELQPAAETRLTDGLTVQVFRLAENEVAEEKLVPFPTEYRDNPNLAAGHTATIRAGKNGRSRVVSTVTLRDGQVTAWREARVEVLEAPVTRILARGTKVSGTQKPPSAPAPGGRPIGGGYATWYASHAGSGACAHLTLPFGTIVKLVASNGRTAQCRVGDRGPEAWTGNAIDLNTDVFAQLAPLGTGRIYVTMSIGG